MSLSILAEKHCSRFFFFSSRRRHTRFDCDWSSDVCSSDLRATGLVIPAVAGKLDGVAIRVPVEDGSLTDLAVVLGRDVTAGQINEAFAAAAADGPLAGILRYSTDPIVSRDVIGDSASCVFDSPLTQASGTLVKVFGWYDNEWGYT